MQEDAKVPKKNWLSHYEFRRAIAIAWVSKDEISIKERRRMNQRSSGSDETTPATSAAARRNSSQTKTPAQSTGGRRKRRQPSSGDSNPPAMKTPKAAPLKDTTITSPNGPYCRRLDKFVDHFPEIREGVNRPKCALHRWAADMEEKKNVYACTHCRINLCVPCFKVFHTEMDLIAAKTKLRYSFLSPAKATSATKQSTKK